jgi:hypothetical protein
MVGLGVEHDVEGAVDAAFGVQTIGRGVGARLALVHRALGVEAAEAGRQGMASCTRAPRHSPRAAVRTENVGAANARLFGWIMRRAARGRA